MRWTVADIPNQHGRIAVVTGANSGLGLATARALAAKGARVIMACRSVARGEGAKANILDELPMAQLEVAELDLASLDSIRRFADWYHGRWGTLDLLFNNAGVMIAPRGGETADSFELFFGTNHLGHFALTGRLIPALLATAASRVVTTTSNAHRHARLDFADLQIRHRYSGRRAYAQSKLANVLFGLELQRRLAAVGSPTISVLAHPGFAASRDWSARRVSEYLGATGGSAFAELAAPGRRQQIGPLLRLRRRAGILVTRLFAQSAERGALPQLYAGTAPGVKGGQLFGPDGRRELRGYPALTRAAFRAYDETVAARLWQESENLTAVDYQLPSGKLR